MQITNGSVEYSRTVRPADFESKAAKVTLTFAVDETEANPDAVVARVFDMAMMEVHRRLGLKVETDFFDRSRHAEADYERATMPTGHNDDHIREALQAKRDADTKAKREAAAAPQENPTLPSSAPASATPEPASPTPTADPLAIVAPPTATVPDKPVEITDSDLHAAVHQALERKVTALQVRNLADEFTGEVAKSMRTLPQDKRAAFVAALKELRPE